MPRIASKSRAAALRLIATVLAKPRKYVDSSGQLGQLCHALMVAMRHIERHFDEN
jgi:hypothetical protein